ncbi:MAG: hypothetical protein LBN94_00425, partial [Puniceicoccales bacterium]|nr:hypothetical protein [Puniceicoccales bacterium]
MWVNSVTGTVVFLLLTKLMGEILLEKINNRHIFRQRGHIPHGFETFIDESTYQRSIDYTLVKSEFKEICAVWGLGLDIAIIFFGILPLLFQTFTNIFGTNIWGQAITYLTITMILSFFTIPASWYRQFRLEESFGFNRSTQAIFWSDKLKGYVISLLFGSPLIAAMAYLFQEFPHSWWILAWGTLMGFQVVMIVL